MKFSTKKKISKPLSTSKIFGDDEEENEKRHRLEKQQNALDQIKKDKPSLEERETLESIRAPSFSRSEKDSKLSLLREGKADKESPPKEQKLLDRKKEMEELWNQGLEKKIERGNIDTTDDKEAQDLMLRQMFPIGFGKTPASKNSNPKLTQFRQAISINDDENEEKIDQKEKLSQKNSVIFKKTRTIKDEEQEDGKKNDDSEVDDDDLDEDEEENYDDGITTGKSNLLKDIPIEYECVLDEASPSKASITAIAFDPAGARFAIGSFDYDVKLYDFVSMDRNLRSFRSFNPFGPYPINTIEFSPTGGKLLISAGSNAGRVFDRDGREELVCPHGDMYLHDMAQTRGHVAPLNCAKWLPHVTNQFATCAGDGTIRFWDVNMKASGKHLKIFKMKDTQGRRASASYFQFARDGSKLVAGCDDGSLRIYDPRSFTGRAAGMNSNAHEANTETTCIQILSDNYTVMTRTQDNSVRIWDLRNIDEALSTIGDLINDHSYTGIVTSPDEKVFATGTSCKRKSDEHASIHFFDRYTFSKVGTVDVDPDAGSVIALSWHPTLNQIAYGCANGRSKILYDPKISHKGVLGCLNKQKKRQQTYVADPGMGKIYTPNALPMFRDPAIKKGGMGMAVPVSEKKQKAMLRKDEKASKKPRLPDGPLEKGGSKTLAEHLATQSVKATWMEEDPREALLRREATIQGNSVLMGSAYAQTQPKPIFHNQTAEQEEEERRKRLLNKLPEHLQKKFEQG